MAAPEHVLPLSQSYSKPEDYVNDLLDFITTSPTLQTLCGGVHILDFLTREDDLYKAALPLEWRQWFDSQAIGDILDSLMRRDLSNAILSVAVNGDSTGSSEEGTSTKASDCWEGHPVPPPDLIDYVRTIHRLSLDRGYIHRDEAKPRMTRQLAAGMTQKKFHEVERFASFVDQLVSHISHESCHSITHLVDFGSGQNYLGRVLAGEQYKRRVVAMERRTINIEGAKRKDVKAKLAKKEIVVWRNKKRWRATGVDDGAELRQKLETLSAGIDHEIPQAGDSQAEHPRSLPAPSGRVQYVQQSIDSGALDNVINEMNLWSTNETQIGPVSHGTDSNPRPEDRNVTEPPSGQECGFAERNLLVMSLHSCGNLIHHGLRSLVLNPSVKAVAMVGCCYNLCTERVGPPTYKLPGLRTANRRLEETSSACDPHGFPMSERFVKHEHKSGPGIRFNITARMMAVQAPYNWTKAEYDSFFTRHFFRALLQRIFLDRGFVSRSRSDESACAAGPGGGEPVIIGSLRKACYTSFLAYVRGAVQKLARDPELESRIEACLGSLTDEEIAAYEKRFRDRKHHLCVLWSLMAFSASVVESAIVVDRWLYLEEQPQVKEAWVQTVFEYEKSPRNLVVVGIKR